ncbi:MAG TPA: hypothetical protein VJ327_08625, partial [Patescibacteria group bacterium]|nr:hypothetical protein [Patescibacteria group bacterium]
QDTIKKLQDISAHKVPKVAAMALTATAKEFKKTITDMMPQVFDRPTPYTLKSLYLLPATPSNLTATVWFKWGSLFQTQHYLAPHVYGGGREFKKAEILLQNRRLLPQGMYMTAGGGARLNKYGNISGGQMTQILSAVKAFPEVGYMMNITARSRKRNKNPRQYFVGRPGGGNKPLGVWERYGAGRRHVRPILMFVKKPSYKKRLPFYETAQSMMQPTFRREFIRLADETIQFNKNK